MRSNDRHALGYELVAHVDLAGDGGGDQGGAAFAKHRHRGIRYRDQFVKLRGQSLNVFCDARLFIDRGACNPNLAQMGWPEVLNRRTSFQHIDLPDKGGRNHECRDELLGRHAGNSTEADEAGIRNCSCSLSPYLAHGPHAGAGADEEISLVDPKMRPLSRDRLRIKVVAPIQGGPSSLNSSYAKEWNTIVSEVLGHDSRPLDVVNAVPKWLHLPMRRHLPQPLHPRILHRHVRVEPLGKVCTTGLPHAGPRQCES